MLQEIVVQVEDSVDTNDEAEDMNTVELFDSAEDLAKFLPLGLNQEYDLDYTFSPKDLVVIGGHRGGGDGRPRAGPQPDPGRHRRRRSGDPRRRRCSS